VPTSHGLVTLRWERKDNILDMDLTVPQGCTAEVFWGEARAAMLNGTSAEDAPYERCPEEDGETILLPEGTYRLQRTL
jgi:hypothetical protein